MYRFPTGSAFTGASRSNSFRRLALTIRRLCGSYANMTIHWTLQLVSRLYSWAIDAELLTLYESSQPR